MKKDKERDSSFYNNAYAVSKAYCKPPEEIPEYYSMWMAGAEHVRESGATNIIDLGCGAGHFAEIIKRQKNNKEIKIDSYIGYDFSETALNMARKMVNDLSFIFKKQDLYNVDLSRNNSKNTMYVSYEFLEHIEGDLDILKKIPSGSKISFSVPSFSCKGHVRHFLTESEILSRYNSIIDIKHIQIFTKNKNDKLLLFLCYGKIK